MDDDTIDEIRRSADIKKLIGQHNCPHCDAELITGSVDGIGAFYCFRCGTGGDAFQFFMRLEGLTFEESVRRVSEMTNSQGPI